MTENQLYQFIKNNVSISIGDKYETDYGNSYTVVEVSLWITNPETNEQELINRDTIQIERSSS